jgi:hypothetical protein
MPFGVRRLVAALESVFWPGNGSLLPFSGEINAWLLAHRDNPGSKLPACGSPRLLKAATSRRTPNAPWVPCIQNYATSCRAAILNRILAIVYRNRALWAGKCGPIASRIQKVTGRLLFS